ncbi:META domain-containing protein [Sphingomonas sp. LHG3406-1]|uniref:META domain-containing protein n=1 Tax=Sphingomonas sp. LHG3406-1 TaxID=2804617 RepID=UPI002607F2EA|nr:META domain-containing protein [Sphingomonas sp. LHG3406-1]
MRLMPLAALALLAGCATVPPAGPPAMPGSTYKAVGTEPFWALELNGRDMVFSEANAPGMRIVEPQPQPIHGFAGDIYQGRRINLNIVRGQRCSDGMSDRVYADKVQVRVDGRSFEGCGGETPAMGSIEGDWSVLAVSRQIVSSDSHRLSFGGGRLSGQFGCNRMSGPYRVEGQTLIAGPVVATRMACPDMRAETAASQILAMPMRMAWTERGDLVLENEAGEIRLSR